MRISEHLRNIGRAISYHPNLKRLFGSCTATIFFEQIFYWSDKGCIDDGWIFKTSEDIEEETGLTYKEQRTARRLLSSLGVLEEKHERLKHRMLFRIDNNRLDELYSQYFMGISRNDQRAVRELTNGQFGNLPMGSSFKEHKITTEITTENKNINNNNDIVTLKADSIKNDCAASFSSIPKDNFVMKKKSTKPQSNGLFSVPATEKPKLSSDNPSNYYTKNPMEEENIRDLEKIIGVWNQFSNKQFDSGMYFGALPALSNCLLTFNLSMDGFIKSIENYREALSLPNSRANEWTFIKWLNSGIKNYLPGVYDPERFSDSMKHNSAASVDFSQFENVQEDE